MTVRAVLTIAGALALGVVAARPAEATVVSVNTRQGLSASPYSVVIGTAGLLFTSATTGYGPGAAVESTGTAHVATIFGGVADFESGAPIDGNQLFTFGQISPAQAIPYSAALDYIGFSFEGMSGTQYGFAEVFGPTLIGYAYQTDANASISTFDVPEPASIVLLLGGLAGVAATRRRQKGGPSAA